MLCFEPVVEDFGFKMREEIGDVDDIHFVIGVALRLHFGLYGQHIIGEAVDVIWIFGSISELHTLVRFAILLTDNVAIESRFDLLRAASRSKNRRLRIVACTRIIVFIEVIIVGNCTARKSHHARLELRSFADHVGLRRERQYFAVVESIEWRGQDGALIYDALSAGRSFKNLIESWAGVETIDFGSGERRLAEIHIPLNGLAENGLAEKEEKESRKCVFCIHKFFVVKIVCRLLASAGRHAN